MTLLVLLLAALLAAAWGAGRATRVPSVRPASRRAWRRAAGLVPTRPRQPPDLGLLVAEVASRLRAGATPEAAWTAGVGRLAGTAAALDAGSSPPVEAVSSSPRKAASSPPREAVSSSPREGSWEPPRALTGLVRQYGHDPAAAAAVHTVVVASRLTHVLGAPLAEVLDRCAVTVTEAQQAHDARRVALAGPRSTARILTGLPLLGLLLGAGLGADPLAAATDGGWGSASVLVGILLVLAGRRWTTALVAAAEGAEPARGRTSRWGGA